MSNPSSELIAMILSAKDKADKAEEGKRARSYELQRQFDAMHRQVLAADEKIQALQTEYLEWRNMVSQSAKELFVIGAVVRFLKRHSTDEYVLGVVSESPNDSLRFGYYPVSDPPSRRKYADGAIINADTQVLSPYEIEDPKLRQTALKLIAKIRMKDW